MGSIELGGLSTEARNPRSERLDEMSTVEMLTVMNEEDAGVAAAVQVVLAVIAKVVDSIAARFAAGGRLFYVGAGTSGRLGVLDASECPPTFSVPPELFVGLIAGGDAALRRSSEESEDSTLEGMRDLAAAGFSAGDAVVGIAASGRTPYVVGALEYAGNIGGLTVALCCVADSVLGRVAELAIEVVTGPEVLTGSTRMKAGTATKMVLNMISTGVMVRQGAVFGNLMVNMQASNEKLRDRAERIITEAVGCPREWASQLLRDGGSVKVGIVMGRLGVERERAEEALREAEGRLREALEGVTPR